MYRNSRLRYKLVSPSEYGPTRFLLFKLHDPHDALVQNRQAMAVRTQGKIRVDVILRFRGNRSKQISGRIQNQDATSNQLSSDVQAGMRAALRIHHKRKAVVAFISCNLRRVDRVVPRKSLRKLDLPVEPDEVCREW